MFLKEIKVKNFRSLRDVDVIFNDSTILIGENNSGKSTLLDAIRKGLLRSGTRTVFEDYDFFMDPNKVSPRDSEGIKIILIFEEKISNEWAGDIGDTFNSALQYLDSERASIILQTEAKYNDVTSEIEVTTKFLNNEFEPISTKVQNLVGRFIALAPVFYLQALRELKDTFSAKSPLWGGFMKKLFIPQEQLVSIRNQITDLNMNIISNDENLTRLIEELQNIQKVIRVEGKDQEIVSIDAIPLKTWDLLSRSQVVLKNGCSSIDLPLEKHGQGTQSVTAILLFKAYISILLKELSVDSAEAILTLEEPEAHLHPQAIRSLHRVINEIGCQRIITTHSPCFIQNADIRDIRFLKKENGLTSVSFIRDSISFSVDSVSVGLKNVVKAYPNVIGLNEEEKIVTIREPLNQKIEKSVRGCCKDIVSNIDQLIAEAYQIFSKTDLCDLNMYIQRNRGDILFARKWFLYEGQSEDVIIPYFARLLNKNFDEHGVSGIMYRSNGTAGAFIKLAKVLNIQWFLLGDNDEQGKTTMKEVFNCGYTKEEVKDYVSLTSTKDFEHELSESPSILMDYESILANELTEDIKKLKEINKDEYRHKIVEIIQKGKIENAYKLVEIWDRRGLLVEDIPKVIVDLIERL